MLDLQAIKDVLMQHKEALYQEYKLQELGIFGSYVREEATEDSDLDILVEFIPQSGMSLLEYIELEETLSELLDTKVDLVQKSGLKPYIGQQILSEVVYL